MTSMPVEDPAPIAVPPSLEEIVIRPPDRFRAVDMRELWRYRDTLLTKARQRVRLQYDDMLLGFFWAVARPVIMVLVFWGFRGLSQAKVGVTIPYPLYVYSGLVFWFYFTDATTSVAMSLQKDAGLIQKVYFPRLLSPLSHLLADTYSLLLACVPMAILRSPSARTRGAGCRCRRADARAGSGAAGSRPSGSGRRPSAGSWRRSSSRP